MSTSAFPYGEANRIHGTKVLIVLGIPPPRPSVPTKPSDHGVLLFFEDNKLPSPRVAYCSPRVPDFPMVLQGPPTSAYRSQGRYTERMDLDGRA
jgi:hypothetical protein